MLRPARSPAPPLRGDLPFALERGGMGAAGWGAVTAAPPAARAYVMLSPSPVAALTPLTLSTWRAARCPGARERGSPARPSPAHRPIEGSDRAAPASSPEGRGAALIRNSNEVTQGANISGKENMSSGGQDWGDDRVKQTTAPRSLKGTLGGAPGGAAVGPRVAFLSKASRARARLATLR